MSERPVSAMEFFAQMIAEHVSRTQVAATEQRLVQTITRELDAVSTHHQVRAEIEQGLTTFVDATALGQVLGHLLDNAVKYSPAEGAITVVGHRTAEGVALAVVDAGVHLPDGVNIFEAFQRGASTEVGAAPGVGLGLHIVRTLVEAMGGSVTAESGADAGTKFTVNLPMLHPGSAPSRNPGN